jgi:CheY-like chemotaxis protein
MPIILCVDDSCRALRMLSSVFQMCGFSVLTAECPTHALSLVETTQFDLAVLDYEMPGLLGTALAREIRRIKPAVPILLHSGSVLIPEDELDAVDAFSAKGESVESFLFKVRELLTIGTARARYDTL